MALYDDVFEPQPIDQEQNSELKRVIEHIGAHLHQPLPVNELAQLSGLSRAHFSRVFAAQQGVPPAQFVLQKRLERAVKLLTMAADLPVKEYPACAGSMIRTTSPRFSDAGSGSARRNLEQPECIPVFQLKRTGETRKQVDEAMRYTYRRAVQ